MTRKINIFSKYLLLNLVFVLLQIYTDWANHYLEKARSKKRVNCLATDCSDGVLLAEVIESVSKYIHTYVLHVTYDSKFSEFFIRFFVSKYVYTCS